MSVPSEPVEPPDEPRVSSGPVYAVAALTFTVMIAVSSLATVFVAAVSVGRGETTVEALLEGQAGISELFDVSALLASIALSSGTIFVAAMIATLFPRTPAGALERWRARLRLVPVSPLDVAVATVGALGVGSVLDALVFFLGLSEFGALGLIHRLMAQLGPGELVLAALVAGLLPGVAEEVFFRGYALRRIAAADGTKTALVASSLAFGIFHMDPVHTPTAAIIGLYLGFCVLWTGSLWTGVVAHVVNNALATLQVQLQETAASHAALLAIGLLAATGAVRFLRRRHGPGWPEPTRWW